MNRPDPNMLHSHLPNEVILSIADILTRFPDVNHLSQTCYRLYGILNLCLYQRHV